MRILLISDTHGDLAVIDQRVAETHTSAVIHAGDFGFHDRDSVHRVSTREVALAILHSDLPRDVIREAKKMKPEALHALAAERLALSQLPDYIEGKRGFRVPVHAIWGNHEDAAVIESLRSGTSEVTNLTLLDERSVHRVGPLRVFGLGGNVIPGRKLFDAPLAGHRGKVWTTLAQMARLVELAGPEGRDEVRVLVTHVSPGKEPLVGRLAAHLQADLMISGHMGSPYCAVWNEFAVREYAESRTWLESRREVIEQAWCEVEPTLPAGEHRRLVEQGLELVRSLPGEPPEGARLGHDVGRSSSWFRGTFAINLPDAADGHAVLVVEDGNVGLETYSKGRSVGAGRGGPRGATS